MPMSEIIGAWVAVGLTLCMFSFLYKDNPLFKFGEHLYVGVSVGYGLTILIFTALIPKWYTQIFVNGEIEPLIPTIIGLLLLTQLTPKFAWLSKISIAFIMGYSAGVAIPRTISSYLLQQTQGTISPLFSKNFTFTQETWFSSLSAILIALGVVTVLIYFFFSVEHKSVLRPATKLGIIFLMISFGASFGYTAMARMSLLYGRCYELYNYTDKKYYYATFILLVSMILLILLWEFLRKRTPAGPDNPAS